MTTDATNTTNESLYQQWPRTGPRGLPPANDPGRLGWQTVATSPGPYEALTMAPTTCGAIPLQDANGNIIGWATDRAGHTSEDVMPEGRTPDEIALNARLLAEAHTMRVIIAVLVAAEPSITARLMLRGRGADPLLSDTANRAREVLARIHPGVPLPAWPLDAQARPNPVAEHARLWRKAQRIAPLAPLWFCTAIAGTLSAPNVNADGLLIVADMLDECASVAAVEGKGTLAAQLRELADLPREMATAKRED